MCSNGSPISINVDTYFDKVVVETDPKLIVLLKR